MILRNHWLAWPYSQSIFCKLEIVQNLQKNAFLFKMFIFGKSQTTPGQLSGDPCWGRDPQVGNRCFKWFLSAASNIWNALPNHLSSIPTLPAFRRALKHHLFLLVYPDRSAKSGKIKPTQCITLCDTAPTTAIAQPGNTMLSSWMVFHLSAYD